ncbi:MAG: patatin-like phospholipase family protein [Bacteroidia bacterium]|nr:patatin-like phospholipase family protein [Bacteroidia bacterium]
MANQYENLVFKGGGVLGIAYAGALKALEGYGVLQNIKRVAGTSAGAISAALVSLKIPAATIKNIVDQTAFSSFMDGNLLGDALHTFKDYGFYKGDAFLAWMKTQIENSGRGLSGNATFADFKQKGCLELHVFATDLNTKTVKEFSTDKTPTVIVAEAVRASMSIPLFFEAWQFPSNNPDNHIYVDGGMVFNYPLTIFDVGNVPNPKSLGLFLTNLGPTPPPSSLTTGQFPKYISSLVSTMLDAQAINFLNDPTEKDRSIVIDNLGISPTNFNITGLQKSNLFDSGEKYAAEFLQAHG